MLAMLQDAWSDPGASSVGFELQEVGDVFSFAFRVPVIATEDSIGRRRGRENGWRIFSISGAQFHLPPAFRSASFIHG